MNIVIGIHSKEQAAKFDIVNLDGKIRGSRYHRICFEYKSVLLLHRDGSIASQTGFRAGFAAMGSYRP